MKTIKQSVQSLEHVEYEKISIVAWQNAFN